jgi:hypothetical protein
MKEDTNQPGLSWTSPKNPPQAATKPAEAQPSNPASVQNIVHSQAPVYAGLLVGGIIAGVLLANAWTSTKPAASGIATSTPIAADQEQTSDSEALPFKVADQRAGSDVVISGLTVKTPTWVVIHVSRDGKPGNALGAKLFFAGDKQGKINLLRDTEPGQTYFVGMRTDNGNRIFSLSTDKPLTNADGSPLWATFKAR